MVPLELEGSLSGLSQLSLADLPRYKEAVTAGEQQGWGYYFPYLLARHRPGRSAVLVGEESGSLCLFAWTVKDGRPRVDVYLAPTPIHPAALRRCLERANEFNGDRSARVLRIDAKDAPVVEEVPGLVVRRRRLQYVFAPGDYVDLGGTRYRTVRRKVNLLEGRPEVEVQPFTKEHVPACHQLLRRWKADHRETHGTAGGAGGSRRAIDLVGSLPERDLRGEVVLLDGELAGFALGGEIRPGLGCAYEKKCDNDVRGLTFFQFRSLLLSLRGFDRINDGSDTGREGLRQFKDSFRPVEMHAEYRATQG